MVFYGVKIRFDCTNNQQYKSIGDFWKFMTDAYPTFTLKGVGCNWSNDSFDYIIGDFAAPDFDMDKIKEHFTAADNVEINLPDKGWKTYMGKTQELSKLYDEIYKDGALDYEIEEFFQNDDCKISICRLQE